MINEIADCERVSEVVSLISPPSPVLLVALKTINKVVWPDEESASLVVGRINKKRVRRIIIRGWGKKEKKKQQLLVKIRWPICMEDNHTLVG